MCLLHWGRILLEDEHKAFGEALAGNAPPNEGGWWISEGECEIPGVAKRFTFGFYHSRLIVSFALTEAIASVGQLRELRERVQGCARTLVAERVLGIDRGPKAVFTYCVFEIESAAFWRSKGEDIYGIQSTCFYTELPDPDSSRYVPLSKYVWPKPVKLRISGGGVVASSMSKSFRWNLINIVYHEGLYRESRSKQKEGKRGQGEGNGQIYEGVEDRLEQFADELMDLFSQLISNRTLTRLTASLVALTAALILVTLLLVVLR
jgi:hypothetical protein